MLNEDNIDEEYKSLILQQIAKIQHQRTEAEKLKLIEKEKKSSKGCFSIFQKTQRGKVDALKKS